MTAKSDEVKQARWSLIQQAFDEICNVPSYSNLYSNTFRVITNFGLQLKAKEESLFDGEDWYNLVRILTKFKVDERYNL